MCTQEEEENPINEGKEVRKGPTRRKKTFKRKVMNAFKPFTVNVLLGL